LPISNYSQESNIIVGSTHTQGLGIMRDRNISFS